MKILRLYFKNINSLQGEHWIDFTQGPLAQAGVFAITGPNGSGKSSILDALTLALYGETFKFDRPADFIMTRHTSDCFAQVEFSVSELQYRAHWQVQRLKGDPNAQTLPPNMQLTRMNDGVVLAEDCTKARAEISSIIGLDFRNFTRSTLLAQGDFAAFLHALDSERLGILEKIIGEGIYHDYQRELAQNVVQEQATLDALTLDLDALPLLDASTQEARELDLADFNAQLTELRQTLQTLEQHIEERQTLVALEEQYANMVAKQAQLQQKLHNTATQLQQITRFRDAAQLQTAVNSLTTQQDEIVQAQTILNTYRQELAQLQTQLAAFGDAVLAVPPTDSSIQVQQELLADLAFQTEQLNFEQQTQKTTLQALEYQLAEKQAEAGTVNAWLNAQAQDAQLLDNFPDLGKLNGLRTQIAAWQKQQKIAVQQTKQLSNQLKNNQATQVSLAKAIPELQAKQAWYQAECIKVLQNNKLEDLEALRVEQQERVNDFKELLALAKVRRRFRESWLVRLGLVRRPEELDASALQRELDHLQQRLLTEENIKKALTQAVGYEVLLKKMQPERIHLTNNEPCPLCGALKHPFVTNPPKQTDSKQALVDQNKRIQTLNASIAKIQQQLQTAQKQQRAKQVRSERILRIEAEWLTLCNRLNVAAGNVQIDRLKPVKRLLAKHVQELNDIDYALKTVRGYQKKLTALELQLATHTNTLVRVQQALHETVPQESVPSTETQERAAQLSHSLAQEQQLTAEVTAQLARLGEKLPAKGKEDALFERLNKRRQTYQTYVLRANKLASEISALQQQVNAAQAQLSLQGQKIQETGIKFQTAQQGSLHLAIIEKQKLLAAKEATASQLNTARQTARQTLDSQAHALGIKDSAQLQEILQLLPHESALQEQRRVLTEQLEHAAFALQGIQAQQQAQHVRFDTGLSLAACSEQRDQVLETMAVVTLEIERLQTLLANQAQLQEKRTILLAKHAEQQARWQQAYEVAQASNEQGHAFRRKVQRQMADRLLAKTNQILEKINGRFYMRPGESEHGLALEVEDTFQHNTRRLPKTLSGGESFVVSLALALGLSELASNGQALEALFLDEGFGNLDADTLYTVVTTLESLPTQGKKVGVISHIDALRKRFKTQIALRKKADGLSELHVVA